MIYKNKIISYSFGGGGIGYPDTVAHYLKMKTSVLFLEVHLVKGFEYVRETESSVLRRVDPVAHLDSY